MADVLFELKFCSQVSIIDSDYFCLRGISGMVLAVVWLISLNIIHGEGLLLYVYINTLHSEV